MSSTTKKIADVLAHSPNIGTSLTRYPVDSHVSFLIEFEQFGFINMSNSDFFFDCRNQRRSLEACSSKGLKSLFDFLLGFVDLPVKLENSNVLLTSRLLSLHESRGIVDAGDEAAGDFRVQGT